MNIVLGMIPYGEYYTRNNHILEIVSSRDHVEREVIPVAGMATWVDVRATAPTHTGTSIKTPNPEVTVLSAR